MGTTIATTDYKFPNQTALYHGKVRDVYTIKENLLISVATDRISAFDVILPKQIPYKGQVLNQLAAYFLNATKSVVDNWLKDVPDPNVSVGIKAEPFKIEMVVRGCLVGHAWREYEAGKRELCGESLADGLKQYDKIAGAIITPSTKAEAGHDEDISPGEILSSGLATQTEWDQLKDYSLKLFVCGQKMASEHGLFLADTKYEFGKINNKIILIDEVHTPDSSRYFYLDSYEKYLNGQSTQPPKHLSKEFVREWLMDKGFSGQAKQSLPNMDDEFVNMVSERYIELYEKMSGQDFIKDSSDDPIGRIEAGISTYLEKGIL
jgi:phosphoribosylaminoimidazole-succinocarboxamide synthase